MTRLLLAGILILSVLTACGGDSGAVDQAATAEAFGQSIILTATAAAVEEVQPDQAVETVVFEATEQVIQAAATKDTAAAEAEAAAAATAEALVPIQQELATYGVDPNAGNLAWQHPPLLIEAEGYMEYNYDNQFLGTVAQDFVLVSDITWNTQFGTTGCGFVVRSDGNEENLNQYLAIATRGASGHVLFFTQIDGEVDLDLSTDIYANGIDPLFDWQNDTTNRIAIVGRGNTFTLFTNGTEIGVIEAQAGFEKGFVAFVALNESGYTRCQFDNSWLWLIN